MVMLFDRMNGMDRMRSALVLVNCKGHGGGLHIDLQLCVLGGCLRGFGVCFFVGGFWNAPDACVNGGAFRQDKREGQDALRVGFGQL